MPDIFEKITFQKRGVERGVPLQAQLSHMSAKSQKNFKTCSNPLISQNHPPFHHPFMKMFFPQHMMSELSLTQKFVFICHLLTGISFLELLYHDFINLILKSNSKKLFIRFQ